jgi:hypothetical protein
MFIVEHIGGGSMAIYMKDTGQRVAVYQLSSSATYMENALLASELMGAYEKYLRNILKNNGYV